ncbi:potassium transporter TrkG [soil metagenome]
MPIGDSGRRSLADHPARFVVSAFLAAIAAGTVLLLLPVSTAEGESTDFVSALFTATSAVCVTGLSVFDVGTHLSGFGQGVLLVLAQVGSLGFMTLASLIAMLVSHRLGLRLTLATTTERGTLNLGDVRRVLGGVAVVTVGMELVVAAVLAVRLRTGHGYAWDDAAWHGLFHSVMAFSNAGFSLYPDSLNRFAFDPIVTGAVMISIVVGGLGFPVLVDLFQRRGHPHPWRRLTLHTRLTLVATGVLLAAGFVIVLVFEWGNPATLGPHSLVEKGWLSAFGSVTPRTGGFHTIWPGRMTDEGLLGTMALMFVGAGSAGTSGGIKVGTFAVLGLVILAELRGSRDVVVFGRRLPERVQRQALTVALLAIAVVAATTTVLLWVTDLPLRDAGFEATSAFGTAGLSTGVTGDLPASGRLTLAFVMLVGRLGPLTLGTALVLRFRTSRIRHPEEAPLIG